MNKPLLIDKPVMGLVLLVAGFGVLMSEAQAGCTRDDVQFYLDRGFTTEQVTQLCGTAKPAQPSGSKYRAYTDEYVDREDESYQVRVRAEREVFLRSSIAAGGVALRGGNLFYTREICVAEGNESEREVRRRACPQIRFRIRLADLEINPDPKRRRLLFGQNQIEVTGNIQRTELPGSFSEIPDLYWQDILRAKLEKGPTTRIPLRSGVDFQFAYDALRDMVAFEADRVGVRRAGAEADEPLDKVGTEISGSGGGLDDLGEVLR